MALPHPEANPFDDLDAFSGKAARDIERRMNIHRLKNEAQNIVGGEMTTFESPDLPPEVSEQFWRNVVEFERAPRVSMKSKLDDAGIKVLPADQLSDEELPARLWQVIEFFAAQNTFLSDTNHLSDRELYEFLREQAFDSSMPDFPGMNCHLSPIGSCDEDDMIINFRFFANDEARERWMQQFPHHQMPARETAPFDRDRLLPQADYSLGDDDEEWDDEDFEGEDDEEGIPRANALQTKNCYSGIRTTKSSDISFFFSEEHDMFVRVLWAMQLVHKTHGNFRPFAALTCFFAKPTSQISVVISSK